MKEESQSLCFEIWILSVLKQTIHLLSEICFTLLIHKLNLFTIQERLQMRRSREKISE